MFVAPNRVRLYQFNKPNFVRADIASHGHAECKLARLDGQFLELGAFVSLRISHPLISYQPVETFGYVVICVVFSLSAFIIGPLLGPGTGLRK